jgi:hypothetical protein
MALDTTRGVTHENEIPGAWHTQVHSNCMPLFVGDLSKGHTSAMMNGTATFVRRSGKVYAVTCNHVIEQCAGGMFGMPRLQVDKTIYSLHNISRNGTFRSTFNPARDALGSSPPDIGISEISGIWPVLQDKKNKQAIDLDMKVKPHWDEIENCVAGGFADEHKDQDDRYVRSYLALVLGQLASKIGPDYPTFTMESKQPKEAKWFLSGISGGPVYAVAEDLIPIGIVFAGQPGSQHSPTGSDSFLAPDEIIIRGRLLTADTFDSWL